MSDYNDLESWVNHRYPPEDSEDYDEWVYKIERNFQQSGHVLPAGFIDNLAKMWEDETGEQVDKDFLNEYGYAKALTQQPIRGGKTLRVYRRKNKVYRANERRYGSHLTAQQKEALRQKYQREDVRQDKEQRRLLRNLKRRDTFGRRQTKKKKRVRRK